MSCNSNWNTSSIVFPIFFLLIGLIYQQERNWEIARWSLGTGATDESWLIEGDRLVNLRH